MSGEQNAVQDSNLKLGNKSSETVEPFKHLGKISPTNQNYCIREAIKSRLKSGNACYRSVPYSFTIQKCKGKDI